MNLLWVEPVYNKDSSRTKRQSSYEFIGIEMHYLLGHGITVILDVKLASNGFHWLLFRYAIFIRRWIKNIVSIIFGLGFTKVGHESLIEFCWFFVGKRSGSSNMLMMFV